ncbi:hypothetical protein [Dysosmobacter sp. Phy]
MRRVRCYDCGKSYNYDEDCFCPNCGAFNQPQRSLRIGADGSVVRVDGINEANHAGSFVHQELHEEKRERRRIGLDKSAQRIQRTVSRPTASRPAPTAGIQSRDRRQSRQQGKNPVGILVWILILIMLFNLLPRILFFL